MRIALNGYGRVGRCFVRALAQREATGWVAPFSLVAINDVMDAKDMLYLSQYDSTHGPFAGPVALVMGSYTLASSARKLFSKPPLQSCLGRKKRLTLYWNVAAYFVVMKTLQNTLQPVPNVY